MHSFYKGKTVLITGSTGFKGSWLSLWLHSLGANVIGYSLSPSTEPNLFSVL
jgi:CDP-glucose 4,6-dehydratase